MLAPSEKHLENWIVNHPQKVLPKHDVDVHGENALWRPLITKIVMRQPQFPHGRPDLVFKSGAAVCVMEIKKGSIRPDVVIQCARYLYDLRDIGYQRHIDEFILPKKPNKPNLPTPEFENGGLKGYVLGSDVSDDVLLACSLFGIGVILYWYDGNTYSFESVHFQNNYSVVDVAYLAHGSIGHALYETMEELHFLELRYADLRRSKDVQ